MKRMTQAELARLAGVSQATVSTVLSGKPDRIPEETRRRVIDLAHEMGYVANIAARSLVGGRTGLIGVRSYEPIFPVSNADFYHGFLEGIEWYAADAGFDLLLFTATQSQPDPSRSSRISLADGALLFGRDPDDWEIDRLAEAKFPLVYIGHPSRTNVEVPYVAADYSQATAELSTMLITLGHRRIGYIKTGAGSVQASTDRESGLALARQAAGLPAQPTFTSTVGDAEDLTALIPRLLGEGVTAILVEQTALAESLFAAAETLGLQIPRDISIVSLGDTIGALGVDVEWTRLVVPREEMGRQATALLIDLIDGRDEHRVRVVACQIETGRTIGPPAAA